MKAKKQFGSKRKYSSNKNAASSHKHLGRFVSKLFGIVIVVGLLGLGIFGDFFRVSNIQVSDVNFLVKTEVESFLQEYFGSQTKVYAYKANLPLVSTSSIKDVLIKKYPIVADISIQKTLPKGLLVNITERDLNFDVCNQNGVCYFVASDGVVVAEGQREDLVNLQTFFEPVIGNNLVSPKEAKWMKSMVVLAEQVLGEKVVRLEVVQMLDEDIKEIRVVTATGYYFLVSDDIDIAKQFYAVQQLFTQNLSVEKRSTLEYIDIRIANKIFYKNK
jgi:cell division septal protein FtsQ